MSLDQSAGTLTPTDIMLRRDLSAGAKITYIVLLGYSQQGNSSPSQEQLGKDTGTASRSVSRYLNELVGAGLISRYRRAASPDVYIINQTDGPTYTPEMAPNPIGFSHSGIVYLMQAGALYKIGYTTAINNRLYQVRSKLKHEAESVEIIHTINTQNMQMLELQLHQRFARQRVYGEWFALTPDDVAAICAISDEVQSDI